MRTIRPGLLRPSIFIGCAVLAGMFITLAVLEPDQALWWLVVGPLGIAAVGWARLRAAWLEITDSVVRVRQGWYLPERQAARSEIIAIHFFPGVISFQGPDRKPIMRIAPNYTLRQMLDVADVLAVPLYDHRRWLGLRKVRIGRLVNPPARSQPVP